MKNIFKVIFLFNLLLVANPLSATDSYPYSPKKVSLYGTLTSDIKFGPPNYGETPEIDTKSTVYILKLVAKITVGTTESLSDINTDILSDVSDLQLIVTDSDCLKLKYFIGRKVLVNGSLEQGVSSGDFLPAIFIVESIVANNEEHHDDDQ